MKKKKPAIPQPPGRHQDWPTKLFALIEQRRTMPFAWGVHDCCLFACDGIRAQMGLDPAAKMFRGRYRDATGAATLLRKHGGVEAIARAICKSHGFARLKSPLLAQRGDVVLIKTPEQRPALGICIGAEAAFPGADGLVFRPVADCKIAWRVG